MFRVALTPRIKRSNSLMYFLVNAPPPKPLDIAASNFAGA